MHDIRLQVRSWAGDHRVEDGAPGSFLIGSYVTINDREILGERVYLDFGKVHLGATEFLTLVIEKPNAEVFRRFDPSTWLMGSDENRLLLGVRSIEIAFESMPVGV